MAIDKAKIEEHIRGILVALGENPAREGLRETPARVARMCEERFEGIQYTNDDIAERFGKCFENDEFGQKLHEDIVLMKDIEIFSFCEHHLALMYNMKAAVAYIPKKKILGLSKIARIADMASKRLQLQERLGADIAGIMQKAAATEDVAVLIEGQHACMTTRGIKSTHAVTKTVTLRGRFDTDPGLLDRFMRLCNA